jgi:DNA-binding transcriptional MerR regulator
MRMNELARRSGLPVPTIKYYLRENLLAAGTATAPNQAAYDERHLRRLRLIRALTDIGGLSVTATRDVLRAADDAENFDCDLLGVTHSALGPGRRAAVSDERRAAAVAETQALVARRGWRIQRGNPALDRLTDVIATLRSLDLDRVCETVDSYADAATELAEQEVRLFTRLAEPDEPDVEQRRCSAMEAVVAGTILGEVLLDALHTLAREAVAARAFDQPAELAQAG